MRAHHALLLVGAASPSRGEVGAKEIRVEPSLEDMGMPVFRNGSAHARVSGWDHDVRQEQFFRVLLLYLGLHQHMNKI